MLKKILLVAPWGKGREYEDYLHPHLGLYRLKSALNNDGVECIIFDPNLTDDPYKDLQELMRVHNFDLAGFSSNHYTLPYDLSLVHFLYKLKNNLILLGGGVEYTLNYTSILPFCPPGFTVVRGEGELVLREFCRHPFREEVPGLVWLEGKNFVFSPPRPPLNKEQFIYYTQLTEWEKIPYEIYWNRIRSYHQSSVKDQDLMTARLIVSNYCPRGCKFCSTTNFLKIAANCLKKPPVHRLPPENVLEIVKRLCVAHPSLKTIFFHDDDFLSSVSWVKKFCEIVCKAKRTGEIPSSLSFICQGSVRNIPYIASFLAQAGFRVIGLGVESFSPNVLAEFNKPQTPNDAHQAITSLLEVGIKPYVNLILSSPYSKVEDLKVTVEGAINILNMGGLVGASLYTLPFPGAEITEKSKEKGLVTYRNHQIEGTSLVIELEDKILPVDPLLKEVLFLTEEKLSRLVYNFKGFRSSQSVATLLAVLQSLKELKLLKEDNLLRQMETILFISPIEQEFYGE